MPTVSCKQSIVFRVAAVALGFAALVASVVVQAGEPVNRSGIISFEVDVRRAGAVMDVDFIGNSSRVAALIGLRSPTDLDGEGSLVAGPSAEFFSDRYPLFRQFRIGNLFFGYSCAGMKLDELAERGPDGQIAYHFNQTLKMLEAVVRAGIKPHIALTGTPRALVPAGEPAIKHPAYGCVNAPPIDWSQSQPRERMPEWWALQDAFFKALIERFGKAEVQGWTFATWTEPLNPTRKLAHLMLPESVLRDGRHDEAVATVLAASIDAAMAHGLRIRLGNLAGPVDKEYPKIVREIGRFARGKAYLDYIDGYAISRYRTKAGQDIGAQLEGAFALLKNPAMPNKPLYIDELGDLAGDDGAEPFFAAAGLDGARFIATALERVFAWQDGTPRRPASVALWSDQIAPRARNVFSQPDTYLKTAASHVTDMFASLDGLARLPVSGPPRLALAGTAGGRVKLLLLPAPGPGAAAAGRDPQPQTRAIAVQGLRPGTEYELTFTEVSRLQGNPIAAFLDGAPGHRQDAKGRFAQRGSEWKLASPKWEACYFDEDASCAWRAEGRRLEPPLVRSLKLRSDATGALKTTLTVDALGTVMIDVAPAR